MGMLRHGLQWGRNFFVTEIGDFRLWALGTVYRFNGAVTFSLRKSITLSTIPHTPEQLQWGRNFFVTEIVSGIRQHADRRGASMGP